MQTRCDNTLYPMSDMNMSVSTQRQVIFRQTAGVCFAHAMINSILVTPVRDLLIGHLAARIDPMTQPELAFYNHAIDVITKWNVPTGDTCKFGDIFSQLDKDSYSNITRVTLLAFLRRMKETDSDDYVVDHSISRNKQVDLFFVFCAQKFASIFFEGAKLDARSIEGTKCSILVESFIKLLKLCDVKCTPNDLDTVMECVFDGGTMFAVIRAPIGTDSKLDCNCVGGILCSNATNHAVAFSVVNNRIRVYDSNDRKPYDLCAFAQKYSKELVKANAVTAHMCGEGGSQEDVLLTFFEHGEGYSMSYYVQMNPQVGGMIETRSAYAPALHFRDTALMEAPVPEEALCVCLMSIALANIVQEPSQVRSHVGGGYNQYANYVLAAVVAAMSVMGGNK